MGQKITKSLYKGEVTIIFDVDSHRYRAVVDGGKSKPVPNVTTIIGQLEKPFLKQWAVNMGVERMLARLPANKSIRFNEIQLSELEEEMKYAHRRVVSRAGDVGHLVHTFAQDVLLGKKPKLPAHAQAKAGANAFLRWLSQHKLEKIETEMITYDRDRNVCGTADLVGKIDGITTLCDFKTGRGIYPEVMLQTAAYQQNLEREFRRKIKRRAVLHISRETGIPEWHVLPDTYKRDIQIFNALHDIYEGMKDLNKEFKAIIDD